MKRRAFSLVELVIVAVVVGLLVALAVPRLSRAAHSAAEHSFARELRVFADAVALYYAENPAAAVLEDSNTGELPAGLEGYLDAAAWADGTPLGGGWDHENQAIGFTAGLGVVFGDTSRVDAMRRVDALIDDGDLRAGSFQTATNQYLNTRFYFDVSPSGDRPDAD